MRYTADLYQVDWDNIQVPTNGAAGEPLIVNGGTAARTRGVEVELNARLNEHWSGSFGFNYTDAKFTSATTRTDNGLPILNVSAGEPLPNAPQADADSRGRVRARGQREQSFRCACRRELSQQPDTCPERAGDHPPDRRLHNHQRLGMDRLGNALDDSPVRDKSLERRAHHGKNSAATGCTLYRAIYRAAEDNRFGRTVPFLALIPPCRTARNTLSIHS